MSESQISLRANTSADTFDLPLDSTSGREQDAKPRSARSINPVQLLQWVFSFPALMGSLLLGAVFYAGRAFHVDPDLWWHIKVGDAILATRRWPSTDTYSFTTYGQPWLAYEWLGDVLTAAVYRAGGIQGLAALLIITGGAVILSLYAFATLRTGNSKAGCLASIILFILTAVSFSLRPQMLGYLFLLLTLIALERFRQGKRRAVWFLPALMLLWVNTHGSWIIGLGTIFVYWMSGLFEFQAGNLEAKQWKSGDRRSLSAVFLLCLAVLPITPYGTQIAISPFEYAFSLPLNVKYIQEWQSMPFDIFLGKFFLVLILGMLVVQVVFRFAWRLEELALFLFGTVMACLHVRFLLVFVPFFAPVLATILARWIPRYDRYKDKFALNAALIACVAIAAIHYFPSRSHLEKTVSETFPVGAVEYIKQHPVPEPMFNNYGFGGYLVWSRGPEHKVFIDGRGDLYERGGVISDYLHISYIEPGTLALLDNYGVQACLLQRGEALGTLLSGSLEWNRIYADDISELYARKFAGKSRAAHDEVSSIPPAQEAAARPTTR